MKYRPYTGTVFVVEGPADFRCLGAHLSYGPDTDDGAPIVTWDDLDNERYRYVAAPEPPQLDPRTDVLTWHNGLGDWQVRPLMLADRDWSYPGWTFPDLATFRAYVEDHNAAAEGEPDEGDQQAKPPAPLRAVGHPERPSSRR